MSKIYLVFQMITSGMKFLTRWKVFISFIFLKTYPLSLNYHLEVMIVYWVALRFFLRGIGLKEYHFYIRKKVIFNFKKTSSISRSSFCSIKCLNLENSYLSIFIFSVAQMKTSIMKMSPNFNYRFESYFFELNI